MTEMVVIFCDRSLPGNQKFSSWLQKYLRYDMTFCLHLKCACYELQKCLLYAWRCVVKRGAILSWWLTAFSLNPNTKRVAAENLCFGSSSVVFSDWTATLQEAQKAASHSHTTPSATAWVHRNKTLVRIPFSYPRASRALFFFSLVAHITCFYSHRLFLKWSVGEQVLAEGDQYIYYTPMVQICF